MTTLKHTPGSWTLRRSPDGLEVYEPSTSWRIAIVNECASASETKRVAALIASAPTLAAENERLREALREVEIWFEVCAPKGSAATIMRRKIRAALEGGAE
jgi:hypothetical protein